MTETLTDWYQRNADATGHDDKCRRRIVPTLTSDSRALDPERCERCQYLAGLLDAAHARHAA